MALNPFRPVAPPSGFATVPTLPEQYVAPNVPNPLPTARSATIVYGGAGGGSGGGRGGVGGASASASQSTQTAKNLIATPVGSPVAIIYGRVQLAANIIAMPVATDSTLKMLAGWGYGPVTSIETVMVDGKTDGITTTHYLGTAAQSVAYPPQTGWSDTLPYIACSYIQYSPAEGGISGIPRFLATIKGRALYDPREESHNINDASTWGWSSNPALALADFCSNAVYGLGRTVNWDDISTLADWCDEVLGDGAKRWTINLAMDSFSDDRQWLTTLCQYAHCFVSHNNGQLRFVPDRAVTSYQRALTTADFSPGYENVDLAYTSMADRPTVVQCSYTDLSDSDGEWRTSPTPAIVSLAGVSDGTTPRRVLDLNMPGIQTYSEAMRVATWTLNEAQQSNLLLSLDVFDIGLIYMPGAVAEVTHDLGLTAKPMRLYAVDLLAPGRWRLSWREYSANIYADVVSDEPSHPDTNLPTLTDPPAVSSVTLTEELFTSGDKTHSRIRASWSAVSYLFCAGYRFTVEGEGIAIETTVAHRSGQTITAVTPPVKDSASYVCTVQTISTIGRLAAAATATLTAQGSLLEPPNLDTLTGIEAGQFVVLQWTGGRDIDFAGYEIRRGTTGQTWGDLSELVTVQDPNYFDVGVPAGTYKYWVAAVDSYGQYSPTPLSVTVTVTADVGGSIATDTVSGDSGSTSMLVYQAGAAQKAVTSYGEAWTDILTADHAWSTDLTYDVWCQHHSAITDVEFVAPEWDLTAGATNRAGTWSFSPAVTALGGATATYEVSLKPTGGAYTDYEGLSKVAAARYMKSKVAHVGGAGKALVITLPFNQQFQGEAMTETGAATSASPAGTVSFTKAFATAPNIFLTLQALPGVTVPYTCAADSIDASGFDLYVWDGNGDLVADASVSWRAEG